MVIYGFFLGHWFSSIFIQTFFHHRYASHKMFTMNKFWERFFHFFSYASQGSSFLVPRAYAIMHRMHHAFSDTKQDPHSPNFFKDVFAMMWHTAKLFNDLINNRIEVSKKFLGNYPTWPWLDRFGNSWASRLMWMSGYIIFYVFFATAWWMYLLLPLHFLMGPVHGAIVNWCGHRYGYQNYDNGDDSRNSLPFDVFLMGELFQNNHHKHPNRPNFAVKPWEFDPMYPVLRLLHFVRVIRLRRADA
ncbi:MAG: acyl-CoA desaturase [Lewinellaceae bacterium]|nr:acyl-CoA desaturase [Lewinellaceae bacterium]